MSSAPVPKELNAEFIDRMVENFYRRIQTDRRLGAIFASRIGSKDWPAHLERMKLFWRSVALKERAYLGQPVQAHRNIAGLTSHDFEQWLRLFDQTVRDLADEPETRAYLRSRAERIAVSLRNATLDQPNPGGAPRITHAPLRAVFGGETS